MLKEGLLGEPDMVHEALPQPVAGTSAGRVAVLKHGGDDAEDLPP